MDQSRRRWVRDRAGNRCEYCGLLQQQAPFASFHIDHVIPKQHGGTDDPSNLALACFRCNLHKGPNLTGIDPLTKTVVRLFNPRQDVWRTHFVLHDVQIIGLTPIGRATIRVLNMNAADRVQLRAELKAQGEL